jgi:hypothetical protein
MQRSPPKSCREQSNAVKAIYAACIKGTKSFSMICLDPETDNLAPLPKKKQ